MSKIILPEPLMQAFSKNEVVLFVGSGLSIDLGLPSWNKLVIDIINHVVLKSGNKNLNMFSELLSIGELSALEVLTHIENKGHKKLAQDYISNALRIKANSNLEIHKKLSKVCPRIITTNYDHAFQQALGDTVHKVSNSSLHGISNLSQKKEYIFKIHGDVDEPDSCILFESDYKNLYNIEGEQQDLFTTQFKSIILNKTILFVGFSLGDPYVKQIMNHIYAITKGTMNKHFLITTNKSFDLPYIHPIVLNKYSELDVVLDIIIEKNYPKLEDDFIEYVEESIVEDSKSKIPKINLLYAEPLDKNYYYNQDLYAKTLNKYQLRVNIAFLNIEHLRNIEEGLIIIFTRVIKGKLIIEDEYLQSRQITHQELLEDISSNINGVIIFTNDLPYIDTDISSSVPCTYIIEENSAKIKRKLDSIFYKLLNKKSNLFSSEDKKIGQHNFRVIDFKKGKPINESGSAKISKYIDKKLLTNFVGRKTDVENIIRKIIDLEFETKILTIKGSGGIGKTTIIIKAVIELANRQIFDSLQYISCQSITSCENFEYQIATCLDFDSTLDILSQIEENEFDRKTIIILDNFETLLQLEDRTAILELISIICDTFIVITTSRQILDLEFEEIYELRNLTTDEGVELFKKYFKDSLSEKEGQTLRYDIVEGLLNNNPLAIKIISKGIPKSKDLNLLQNELKENIFKNENINKIFEKPEDINIEKSSSLFYSIKYGFDKLNEREKFAFELLSLFPDGIHIENLKKFAKQNKNSLRVTDREIKSLDDKSLLENSSGFLKLQSIINRFSSHQFNLRSEEVKNKYYTLCFDYNFFFITFLEQYIKTSDSLRIQDDNVNNYLICIDFLEYVDMSNSVKLDFIDSLALFFRRINQYKEFLDRIAQDKISKLFDENENEKKLLKLIIFQLIYWSKDFNIVGQIKEVYSKNEIGKLDFKNKVEKLSYRKMLNVLTCEGESLFSIKDKIERWDLKTSLIDDLFRIGFIKLASTLVIYEPEITFIEFDILYENDELKIKDLEKYLSKLYKKESLEQIQINYIQIKANPFAKVETSSFVITNPYTKGMVALIKALISKDVEDKHKLYKKAIKHLVHIKYYYTEAIFEYCKFLKDLELEDEFIKYQALGEKLSAEYNFWYLEYKLKRLSNHKLVYNEELIFSKLDIQKATFDLFIQQYQEKNKKVKKKF